MHGFYLVFDITVRLATIITDNRELVLVSSLIQDVLMVDIEVLLCTSRWFGRFEGSCGSFDHYHLIVTVIVMIIVIVVASLEIGIVVITVILINVI